MNKDQKKLKELLHFEKFKFYQPDKRSGKSLRIDFTSEIIDLMDIDPEFHQFINIANEEECGVKFFKGGKNNSIFFLYITTCEVSEDQIIGIGYVKNNNNIYDKEDCLSFLEFLTRKSVVL